jgi:hypothetical protein
MYMACRVRMRVTPYFIQIKATFDPGVVSCMGLSITEKLFFPLPFMPESQEEKFVSKYCDMTPES